MKALTLSIATALAAAVAFVPAPAQADEMFIGARACGYIKSGIPFKRAVELAIKGNPDSFKTILATGATGKEAGSMIYSSMRIMCRSSL